MQSDIGYRAFPCSSGFKQDRIYTKNFYKWPSNVIQTKNKDKLESVKQTTADGAQRERELMVVVWSYEDLESYGKLCATSMHTLNRQQLFTILE